MMSGNHLVLDLLDITTFIVFVVYFHTQHNILSFSDLPFIAIILRDDLWLWEVGGEILLWTCMYQDDDWTLFSVQYENSVRRLMQNWGGKIFSNPSHFVKIHINILPSTPGSSKWSPSLRFPQHPVYTSSLPVHATCPAYLILLDLTTANNLVVKKIMFTHPYIHQHAWTSPGLKAHNQIYHILINRRWHSCIHDV
jgi:hypothetical protein